MEKKEGLKMDALANERASLVTEIEENQKLVRKMVMDSYHDMLEGKGRDCKDFFDELESRYKKAKV